MILLDTNVVSEALKPEPNQNVRDWLDAQAAETLFPSSVTVAELSFGLVVLPEGKRRASLAAALDGVIDPSRRGFCRSIPTLRGATGISP